LSTQPSSTRKANWGKGQPFYISTKTGTNLDVHGVHTSYMETFTETSIEMKKATIALLFKLMGIDDDENPNELAFILHIGDRIGLTDDDLKEVSLNIDGYQLEVPTEEKDRITILYYLLFLMKADGEIRPEEESFVYRTSMRLGFRPEMTADLIGVLKKHLYASVPPQELFGKIQTYFS